LAGGSIGNTPVSDGAGRGWIASCCTLVEGRVAEESCRARTFCVAACTPILGGVAEGSAVSDSTGRLRRTQRINQSAVVVFRTAGSAADAGTVVDYESRRVFAY